MVEDLLRRGLAKHPRCKIVTYPEGRLLTGHLRLKFADPGRDARIAEERLDAIGKVACYRDLDLRSRIESPGPRGSGECHGGIKPGREVLEVSLDSR
ncbi:hypothetical protein DSECCO2_460410 [anaerobic digester metagenome]